jgi:transmembrane sensor
MTSHVDDKTPDDEVILQAAADWFALERGERLTPDDAGRLEAWLEADERHRQAYREVAAAWAIASGVRLDPRVLRGRERALQVSSRGRRLELFGRLAAASVAVAIALGVGITFVSPTSVTTYSTQLGETATFRLADGSKVFLDTQSAVKVWSRKHGQRKLALLRGRAFFEVAPNKARPFVVHVGGGSVTAVGTAFDVEAKNNGMRVVLVEGKVRVLPVQAGRDSTPVEMLAGQELVNTGAAMRLRVADVRRETTWRFGTLMFAINRWRASWPSSIATRAARSRLMTQRWVGSW